MKQAKGIEAKAAAAHKDAEKEMAIQMMKSGEADRELEKARKLKKQQDLANAAAFGGMFTGIAGDKDLNEAKAIEAELAKAAEERVKDLFGTEP